MNMKSHADFAKTTIIMRALLQGKVAFRQYSMMHHGGTMSWLAVAERDVIASSGRR
jgi:hypothetical protein